MCTEQMFSLESKNQIISSIHNLLFMAIAWKAGIASFVKTLFT